jgi:predicted phage terminase large subunit-like protein
MSNKSRKGASKSIGPGVAKSLELAPYAKWLGDHFPKVCYAPLSERHHRLWRWFASLSRGALVPAQVEVWPRGGAKSSTAELGVAYIGYHLQRNFTLYVCGTQDQADLHVQAIGSLFEEIGVERAVGKYGSAKGWRRDQLRTADGFNVAAIGLDVASRGVKLDQFRPDLIIFDDIDSEADTLEVTAKKIRAITTKILPAGSTDCAVLFIQNLIHENSIVSQLVDGQADFLLQRVVPAVEPAVRGLKTEEYKADDGSNRIRIAEGEPTWEGQSLAICEFQINKWGLRAFKREAQQEVKGAGGFFFDEKRLEAVPSLPKLERYVRAWDLAATEGGGDYTVGVLMGLAPNKQLFVLDVMRVQYENFKVRRLIEDVADEDNRLFGSVKVIFPQDPGQAGKAQAKSLCEQLAGVDRSYKPVTGKKSSRANNWSEKVNGGNAKLFLCSEYEAFKKVREIRSDWAYSFREEHRLFREDGKHVYDDQVDAASDAATELLEVSKYEADLAVIKALAERRNPSDVP